MVTERTGYAPWSLTREAGVESATVDGTIKVPQNIQPTLDCGFEMKRETGKELSHQIEGLLLFKKMKVFQTVGRS